MSQLSKRSYNKWKEEGMEEALPKLSKGVMGFDEPHRQFNIPKSTLRRHFKGLIKNFKFGRPKDITKNMEESVERVPNLNHAFFGPTATELKKDWERRLVYQLAE